MATRSVRLRPLTLGLYLEALHTVGADSKTLCAESFDAAEAPLSVCVRFCDLLLADGLVYAEQGARSVAAALWVAFLHMASEDSERATRKVEQVERALGNFLDDGEGVTFERVLYGFDPGDVETLRGWPLWQALEYLGVRAVESDYQAERRKLSRTN